MPAAASVKCYCLKCKSQKEMVDPTPKTTKNGRSMVTGKCKACGTNMSKFVSGK